MHPVKNNKPGLVEVRLTLVVGGVAIGTVGQPNRVGRFVYNCGIAL